MLYLQGHPESGSDAGRPPEEDPQQHPADESADEPDHLSGGVKSGAASLHSAGASEEPPWPPPGLQRPLQTVSGSFQPFGPLVQHWSRSANCSRHHLNSLLLLLTFPV